MKRFKEFLDEDGGIGGIGAGAPANSVGSGAIAGLGVGSQGEPGVSKKKKTVGVVLTGTPMKRKIQ